MGEVILTDTCVWVNSHTQKKNKKKILIAWWRHQMETFSALLTICAGNPPVTGKFPAQRPVTLSFDVFFDLRLNKRLSKQSWGWWFETSSCPLWRHCNGVHNSWDVQQTENKRIMPRVATIFQASANLGKRRVLYKPIGIRFSSSTILTLT